MACRKGTLLARPLWGDNVFIAAPSSGGIISPMRRALTAVLLVLAAGCGAPKTHEEQLEEVFSNTFLGHHQSAVATVFSPSSAELDALVAFILSIDETSTALAIPAKGSGGGSLCFYPCRHGSRGD